MTETPQSIRKELSAKALEVLDTLQEKEKKQVRKGNPFRQERDALIVELRSRGVGLELLSEITGISANGISKIVARTGKRKLKEIISSKSITLDPALVLLAKDFVRERYRGMLDDIKHLPYDQQALAIDRFQLIKVYEDYYLKVNRAILGNKYDEKWLTASYCRMINLSEEKFYQWLQQYNANGILELAFN